MSVSRRVESKRSPKSRPARLNSANTLSVVEPAPRTGFSPIGQFVARCFFLVQATALAFAGYWSVTSPRLVVASVEVRGAYYLKSADVTRAANIAGTSLFNVSTGPVRDRILALEVPRDVSIRFRLPNVVVIAVKERTAAYNLKADGTTFAVSDNGVILGQTLDSAQPLVTELDGHGDNSGDRVDPAVLREAAYLRSAVPIVAGFAPAGLSYSKEGGLSFLATREIQIIIGDDQLLEKKVAALAPVLNAALSQATPPKVIDLRVPTRPIMR